MAPIVKTEDLIEELFNRTLDKLQELTDEEVGTILETMKILKRVYPHPAWGTL